MFEQANATRAPGTSALRQGIIGTESIERVLFLDEIGQRVQATNSDITDAIGELQRLADDMMGSEPTVGDAKNPGGPQPSGRVHGLSVATSETVELVGYLRGQINRLRRL